MEKPSYTFDLNIIKNNTMSVEHKLDCKSTTVIDDVRKHSSNDNGSGDYIPCTERLQNYQNLNNDISESRIGVVVSERESHAQAHAHAQASNSELDISASDLPAGISTTYNENGSGDFAPIIGRLLKEQNVNNDINEKLKLEIGVDDVVDSGTTPSVQAVDNDKLGRLAASNEEAGLSPTYIPTELSLMVPKLDKKELLIPRISSNLQNNALAIITAALVVNGVQLQSSNVEETLSLYCGIYNIYLEFIDNPVIALYLLRSGYKVRETTIEEWTSWLALKRKGVSHIVAHYLEEGEESLARLAWTLMGPLLCLLGHKPNESNIHYWGAKILHTLSIATELPNELLQTLFYPNINFCQDLSNILNKLYELRRQLFIIVYNTASLIPSIPGIVCRLVVELLRGVGLLDFILIDHFLLIQNPFSLLLNAVAKHTSQLLKAYEKFMEYGNLAPWCSIVASPEDLLVFQDPAVKFVAAIARGLALKKGLTSLENYHPTKVTQEIIDTVEKADNLLENMKAHKIQQEMKEEKPPENV